MNRPLAKLHFIVKLVFPLAVATICSGCLVGPNYRTPVTLLPEGFKEASEETVCSDDEDFFEWWRIFNDNILNDMLLEAAQNNFDLKIAIEKICQARAQFRLQAAALYPSFNLDAIATRSRNSRNLVEDRALGPTFQNFFLLGIDVAWELDFFGRLERTKRAAFFDWQSAEENARSVQILMLSEVATNYVAIRALQKKVELFTKIVEADTEELSFVNDRFQAGLASEIDLETVKSFSEINKAAFYNFASLLKQNTYSLGVLLGQPPEIVAEKFNTLAPIPIGYGKIPVGLPSELLRRRPDIRSAERQLASATELIGAAIADLFPKITLTSANFFGAKSAGSNFGFASNNLSNLLSKKSETWSIGPGLSLPIFDFGRRLANIKIQTSLQKQALLTYEKTVIKALQEVETALSAYFGEEKRLSSLKNDVTINEKAWILTQDLFQAGLVDYGQVIEAKKKWINSANTLVDSEQALTLNLISIYKALGGDWECFYSP